MLRNVLYVVQMLLGVLLVLVVIIQQKGAGLGTAFGGDTGFYRTRRGAEKLLFYITIALSLLFVLSSLIGLVV